MRMRERRLYALTLNFGKRNTEGFSLDYRPPLAKDAEGIFVGSCRVVAGDFIQDQSCSGWYSCRPWKVTSRDLWSLNSEWQGRKGRASYHGRT